MLGAIIGDIIGSVYEWHNVKTEDFPLLSRESRFTDDSVLTAATAAAILNMQPGLSGFGSGRYYAGQYAGYYKLYGHRYPDSGFGEMFRKWCASDRMSKIQSYGNGAAMCVSPVGLAFENLDEVVRQAKYTTMYTHNHAESIRGACAVAVAVFLARKGAGKNQIQSHIQKNYKYNLEVPLSEIRPSYRFDASCAGSVPQAIRAFLEAESYEDAVRKAVSIGGDSDTIAAIAGGIAEAYFREIPREIKNKALLLLDSGLHQIVREFYDRFQPYA